MSLESTLSFLIPVQQRAARVYFFSPPPILCRRSATRESIKKNKRKKSQPSREGLGPTIEYGKRSSEIPIGALFSRFNLFFHTSTCHSSHQTRARQNTRLLDLRYLAIDYLLKQFVSL